ncbi:hypothetical protein HMN09_00763700 [Mycena chlorophos]|uniref:C-8 sterol isomerase n=1 Tax=Mycena chlorophos TaxID=658473 RepID=A0A8H6SWR3_MYCCL|nr:hypothetical protein HMN09_00763700 [Mycena chlorophos]
MASAEELDLIPEHPPHARAFEAFEHVLHQIKHTILASRHDWDKHEPKMWSLARETADHDLVAFDIKDDLVAIRTAQTAYGVIIFGKIRIRAIKLDAHEQLAPGAVEKDVHGKIKVEMKNGKVNDDLYGFIHVRIHDPPGDAEEDVKFHSIFTDEGKDKDGENNGFYRAIQPNSKPLEFFNDHRLGASFDMASSKKTQQKAQQPPQDLLTKWATRLVIGLLVVAIGSWLDAIKSRWYVFDPTFLHELAQDAIRSAPHENDTASMIQHIVANLTATYPSTQKQIKINPYYAEPSEWVFNNAGGAMGAMYLIHASITEYLIIFGTPLGTEGHTGLHTADDYFNILTGEQWAFRPGALEKERYTPGMVHHLPRGTAKQYKMHEGCFAMEYARGWIPLMMPFGLIDIFSSTLDLPTLYHTVRITGREMLGNLLIGKI